MRMQILPPQTNAYRLLNGEGDLLPGIVVDRYDHLLVLKFMHPVGEPYLDDILDALEAIDGINCIFEDMVFVMLMVERRKRVSGQPVPERLVVQENGLRIFSTTQSGSKDRTVFGSTRKQGLFRPEK